MKDKRLQLLITPDTKGHAHLELLYGELVVQVGKSVFADAPPDNRALELERAFEQVLKAAGFDFWPETVDHLLNMLDGEGREKVKAVLKELAK